MNEQFLTKEQFIEQLNNKRYDEYRKEYARLTKLVEDTKGAAELKKGRDAAQTDLWCRTNYGHMVEKNLQRHFESEILISTWNSYFIINGHKKKDWSSSMEFYDCETDSTNITKIIKYLKSKGVK